MRFAQISDYLPVSAEISKIDVEHKIIRREVWANRTLVASTGLSSRILTKNILDNDGVTFDFLHAMAKELHEENSMVLLAAGANGKDPVILQVNGTPYRGFLEGRIEGDEFILLLHLSNMELKKPALVAKSEGSDE